GKEIAIYTSSALQQWNFYGLDMVGHMNADTTKYYYLKDHIGSIRAVLNSSNAVISAQDYDCWGYLMENRTYQSANVKYKFTGKERDNELESNYDYFGARYYDSRIGRWGQVEPLLNKYVNVTPYNYSLNNPLVLTDPSGKDPNREQLGTRQGILELVEKSNSTIELMFALRSNENRYIYTEKAGFIDMVHFIAATITSGYEKNIFGNSEKAFEDAVR